MPELPEVEIVKRGLENILKNGSTLKKLEFLRADLRDPIPVEKLKALLNSRFQFIERRAKYLIFWTSKGGLISHLGMTGTWRVAGHGEERKHDHIYLYFSDNLRLAYNDPRRFGTVDYIEKAGAYHKKLMGLGPEPLEEKLTALELWQVFKKKAVPIKVAIMDQRILVGVGNIYANEALFIAGIRPGTRSSKLSLKNTEILLFAIRSVLRDAIEKGGSSISDFLHTSGEKGYFQNSFQVYDREGKPCYQCGSRIQLRNFGGRSTFQCPRCQK